MTDRPGQGAFRQDLHSSQADRIGGFPHDFKSTTRMGEPGFASSPAHPRSPSPRLEPSPAFIPTKCCLSLKTNTGHCQVQRNTRNTAVWLIDSYSLETAKSVLGCTPPSPLCPSPGSFPCTSRSEPHSEKHLGRCFQFLHAKCVVAKPKLTKSHRSQAGLRPCPRSVRIPAPVRLPVTRTAF